MMLTLSKVDPCADMARVLKLLAAQAPKNPNAYLTDLVAGNTSQRPMLEIYREELEKYSGLIDDGLAMALLFYLGDVLSRQVAPEQDLSCDCSEGLPVSV